VVSAVEVQLDVVVVVVDVVTDVVVDDIARVVHMDTLLVAGPIVAFEIVASVEWIQRRLCNAIQGRI
jgi:hypothetical protein